MSRQLLFSVNVDTYAIPNPSVVDLLMARTIYLSRLYTSEFYLAFPTLLLDVAKRDQTALQKTETGSVYKHFVFIQHVYSLICSILLFVAAALILNRVDTVVLDSNTYVTAVCRILFRDNRDGWIVLAAWIVVMFFKYTHHRQLWINNENIMFEHSELEFRVAHISVLNSILVFPYFRSPPTYRAGMIATLSIIVIAGCLISLDGTRLYIEAWGCYWTGSTMYDFIYGMCPAAFRGNDAVIQPVCTKPGILCGQETFRLADAYNSTIATLLMFIKLFYLAYTSVVITEYRYISFLFSNSPSKPKQM